MQYSFLLLSWDFSLIQILNTLNLVINPVGEIVALSWALPFCQLFSQNKKEKLNTTNISNISLWHQAWPSLVSEFKHQLCLCLLSLLKNTLTTSNTAETKISFFFYVLYMVVSFFFTQNVHFT